MVDALSKRGKSAEEAAETFLKDKIKLPEPLTPAQESAKVFESAGKLPSEIAAEKKSVQQMVDALSKRGKSAEEAAETLAPKELPIKGKPIPQVEGSEIKLPIKSSRPNQIQRYVLNPEVLGSESIKGIPSSVDDVIETVGKTVPEKVPSSFLSNILKKLSIGGAAYHGSKGEVVDAISDLASGLSMNPFVLAASEFLRPEKTVSSEEEMLQKKKVLDEKIEQDYINSLSKVKDQQLRELELLSDKNSSTMPEKPKTKEQELQALLKTIPGAGTAPEAPTKTYASSLGVASKKPEEQEKQPLDRLEIENQPNFYDLLEQAKQSRDSQILMANLAKAAETVGSGISGMVSRGTVTKPVGTDFYDKLIKQAEQRVEDVGTAYTMKSKQDETERLARRRDPASAESRFARDLLNKQGISVPKGATAEILEKYAPWITNLYNQKENREYRALQAQENRELRAMQLGLLRSEKEEKSRSEQKQKLEKRLSEQSQALMSVEDLESNIRTRYLKDPEFSLDTFDIKEYKGDLAGANIPMLGRTSFYSSEARQLQSDIDTVLNQMIRSFAGKAVTKNELERIKTQFSSGAFNTEAEMLNAMAKAKRLFRRGMKSSEAAFSKEAIEEYKEAGGITSDYGLSQKDPEIQAYADQYFYGDYNEALRKLKETGQI